MFDRFRTIFFVAGILFFTIPLVFLLLPPIRQLAVEKPPSGVALRRYTEEELLGRKIYIREGCWYCHSQFVRPLDFETARYGRKSESWEHLFDLPHLYGTRRIGPDLAREKGKRTDDWHYAHLFSPQSVVKNSIMPAYPWFFEGVAAQPTSEGKALVAYLQSLGRGEDSFAVADEEMLARGKKLFATLCATCHGEKGDGQGPAAAALTPAPRNFLIEEMKYGDSPEAIFKTISEGVNGTAMPPFSTLTAEERNALAAVVLHFRKEP